MKKVMTFLVGLVLLLSGGRGLPQGASEVNKSQSEALRKRVEEYYSLVQLGRYTQAEDYMTPESKETFRKLVKAPFLSFELNSVKMDPGGQSAAVDVKVSAFVGQLSTSPVPMSYKSNWQLLDGLWYLVLPKEILTSPIDAISREKVPPSKPEVEELKFKGHHYHLGTMDRGQKKVARFPFTNVTNHVVTISEVITGTPLLTVENYKKEYKPGESGELAIDFLPVDVERDYAQTVVFRTNPGNTINHLLVSAYVTPKPRENSKEPVSNRPVATQTKQ